MGLFDDFIGIAKDFTDLKQEATAAFGDVVKEATVFKDDVVKDVSKLKDDASTTANDAKQQLIQPLEHTRRIMSDVITPKRPE